MIRANLGSQNYWDKWVNFDKELIENHFSQLKKPSNNPTYRPQYIFELTREHWEALLRRYSRGDSIADLASYLRPIIETWEESEALGKEVFTAQQITTRNDWSVNLDFYIICFWLVGLALIFDINEDLWTRLIYLIGNEGNDLLLDRVIATRQRDRKIGKKICHERPYRQLLKVIDAPAEQRSNLLRIFLDNWYKGLERTASFTKPAVHNQPYWHGLGNENFEGGAYFGRWCIEAAAVAKAFKIDDHSCWGHEHYPGDLLRINGPSTHHGRNNSKTGRRWFKNIFNR